MHPPNTQPMVAGKISVQGALDALDSGGEVFEFFYDRTTGGIVEIPTEEGLTYIEESEIPECERKLWDMVADDESGRRFVKLPTEFEIHEYNIMRGFVDSLDDGSKARVLSDALRGGAAFRGFKNSIERLRIEDDWSRYRSEALRRIVLEWCEAHKIEAVD